MSFRLGLEVMLRAYCNWMAYIMLERKQIDAVKTYDSKRSRKNMRGGGTSQSWGGNNLGFQAKNSNSSQPGPRFV